MRLEAQHKSIHGCQDRYPAQAPLFWPLLCRPTKITQVSWHAHVLPIRPLGGEFLSGTDGAFAYRQVPGECHVYDDSQAGPADKRGPDWPQTILTLIPIRAESTVETSVIFLPPLALRELLKTDS